MSSRTFTVDTKAMYFTGQILLGVMLVVAGWFAWTPFQTLLTGGGQDAQVGGSVADEETHDGIIERLLYGAEHSGAAFGTSRIAQVYHYVPAEGRFVSVDLVNQEVSLYEDGSRVNVVPIMQTAAHDAPTALSEGDYLVEQVSAAELSTLAMVRFPHYVQFGGGYALHGEPTNESGGPLEEEYTGGSVTLANDDAAMVFAFVSEGTPLHVRVDFETPPYAPYTSLIVGGGNIPATSAVSFAMTDLSRGQMLLEKNAGKAYPVASITKLVTAAVASDVVGHGTQVRAPNGSYYTLGDLFYPLLMRSDNKVAARIAAHTGRQGFLTAMNAYVNTLGMPTTSFVDASGLSRYNTSSAYDLATLARHLYLERAYLLDISREDAVTITSTDGIVWNMDNQNKLAGDPHFRGGKLGYTDEAGQTALSIFNVPLDGETRTIAVVILGSKDWKQDTRTLLRWLLENVTVER